MVMEPEQVKSALHSRRVLIVEDDVELATHIDKLFQDNTSQPLALAHCMDNAREIVKNEWEVLDLVIMDTMLPRTREQFEEIQELNQRLKDLREKLIIDTNSISSEFEQDAHRDARFERAQALKRIDKLIDREGGVKLVKEWQHRSLKSNRHFAILFLTALGSEDITRRGILAAGEHSAWLVKPVSSDLILDKSASLIRKQLGLESKNQ